MVGAGGRGGSAAGGQGEVFASLAPAALRLVSDRDGGVHDDHDPLPGVLHAEVVRSRGFVHGGVGLPECTQTINVRSVAV